MPIERGGDVDYGAWRNGNDVQTSANLQLFIRWRKTVVAVCVRQQRPELRMDSARYLDCSERPYPPSVASMTPSSGNGTTQTFTVQFNDPNEGLSFAHILFNTSLSDSQGCHVLYVAALNALYLMNDGGTSYLGPMTPGAAGALQNSQCQLNVAGTSITGLGGTAVTFRLPD